MPGSREFIDVLDSAPDRVSGNQLRNDNGRNVWTDTKQAAHRWLAIGLLTLLAAGCERTAEIVQINGTTMATTYTVKVIPAAALDRDRLARAVNDRLVAVNLSMSTYLPDSELSRLNRDQSTDWLAISAALHQVIETALGISAASGGAFDITVGPLVNLWGFGPGGAVEHAPSEEAIDDARQRVGYRLLELRSSPRELRKARGDVYIDLSGIAKGYAVDEIAALLDAEGIERYMVEIGGEVKARGRNARGGHWRIGIELPDAERRAVDSAVRLENMAMASSGDYRNFFEADGVRYSHTIDLKSGRPIRHRLAAVTVLHASAMQADAWATALMALGDEAGLALARALDIAARFLIRDDTGFSQIDTEKFNILVLDSKD